MAPEIFATPVLDGLDHEAVLAEVVGDAKEALLDEPACDRALADDSLGFSFLQRADARPYARRATGDLGDVSGELLDRVLLERDLTGAADALHGKDQRGHDHHRCCGNSHGSIPFGVRRYRSPQRLVVPNTASEDALRSLPEAQLWPVAKNLQHDTALRSS
jgi:hypothetical protein